MSGPTQSQVETNRRIPARRRCLDAALLIALITTCLGGLPAAAETFTVMNLDDSGAGSLREAITNANGNGEADTIIFDAGLTGSIVLATRLANITAADGLTIDGDNRITVSGNNAVGAFIVDIDANLSLENLTISDGLTDEGGAIDNNGGTVTVTNSTLSGNSAPLFAGGGISSAGTVTLINSTVSGNSAGPFGGGGIFNAGTLTLINSTLSDNSANAGGGGIFNNGGTVTLTNSTLSDNAGGIFNSETGGTVTLINSLIANNPGGDCANFSTIDDGGHNLVGDGSCITVGSNGNLNGDPMLGPLADNGGLTETHALLTGSPAIDAGFKQRGKGPRAEPLGHPGTGGDDHPGRLEACTTRPMAVTPEEGT